MYRNQFFQFLLGLLWQTASPLPSAVPSPINVGREIWLSVGDYVLPAAFVAQLVALAYLYWHSKNREELTKALAEAVALADTRGKRIGDLEKIVSEKDLMIAAKDATINYKKSRIQEMEEEDEKRARTEFRLRGEIAELEKELKKRV